MSNDIKMEQKDKTINLHGVSIMGNDGCLFDYFGISVD